MTDTCSITRASGEPVFSEETGQHTQPTTTVYNGRCRVQASGTQARERDAGEMFLIVDRVVISLPVGSPQAVKDDLVTVTASPHNPQIVSAKYRVRAVQDKSHPTAVRLDCEAT
jgi:Family of unknown function (DUF6093)